MRGRLPVGFCWRRCGGWRVAVREELVEGLRASGHLDPLALGAAALGVLEGRGRPRVVPLPGGGRGVLRRYLHGGLLRRVTGRLFLGSSRSLRELRATERAREAGVPAPEVLAAFHRRARLLLHEAFLLTREVPGARDLVGLLRAGERGGVALEAVGRETRRMHEAGVWHADLHVKNVLVSPRGVTLIDFDRARTSRALPRRARHANLLRFDRSIVKLALGGVHVRARDRLRFFRGYFGGRPEEAERRALEERCRRSLSRHRLAWKVGR